MSQRNLFEIGTQDISSIGEMVRVNNLNPIFEESWRQLRDGMDKGRRVRSKSIPVYYKGVLKTKGWISFITPSQTTAGKNYHQYIKLLDMKDIKAVKEFSKKDILRLMLAGNIALSCDCPDFLYRGHKYMGYNLGYGIYKEARFPKIRNPNLEGTVCKHLGAVLSAYMMNYSSIYRDYTKSYYWMNRYGSNDEPGKKKGSK